MCVFFLLECIRNRKKRVLNQDKSSNIKCYLLHHLLLQLHYELEFLKSCGSHDVNMGGCRVAGVLRCRTHEVYMGGWRVVAGPDKVEHQGSLGSKRGCFPCCLLKPNGLKRSSFVVPLVVGVQRAS